MNITNLVYSGSGTLLPAFCGATEELFNKVDKSQIKRICGTSGGSIFAYLLIINKFDIKEVEKVIMKMDFEEFFDDSFFVFRDIWRLIRHMGWNKGEAVIKFFKDQLRSKVGKDDMNFLQFFGEFGVDFTVIVTNASLGEAVYCNATNTPTWSVVEAIRRSMSIPFFFVPRVDEFGDVYVDGGVCNNFGIKLYDYMGRPEETLGIRLKDIPQRTEIKSFIGMVRAMRRTLIKAHYEDDTTNIDRVVAVFDCNFDGTNPLKDDQKKMLIDEGHREMRKWLSK